MAEASTTKQQGIIDIAPGVLKEVQASVMSMFPVTYKPQDFEDALKRLPLPKEDADAILDLCAQTAKAAILAQPASSHMTNDDAMFLFLYSFDFGPAPPHRASNPSTVLNNALLHRSPLELLRVRDVLWGLLRVLRKLPRSGHSVLFRGICDHVDPTDPKYAPGSRIRWPCFCSTTTDSETAERIAGETGTVYVIRGRDEAHKAWGLRREQVVFPPSKG